MLALRQEALQFVNNVPDNLLSDLVEYLKNFKLPNHNTEIKTGVKNILTTEEMINSLKSDPNVDPNKAAAFEAIAEWQKQNKGKILTRHPITPSIEEIERNYKARSGKLRAFCLIMD